MRNFVVFIVSIVLFSCHQKENENGNNQQAKAINPAIVNNPATASGEQSDAKLPVFDFSVDKHDFGIIKQGEKISYAFKFKNAGKGDLVITSASGSCGCTVAEYPKDPIAPGKESVINIVFDSEGKQGMQLKTVTLLANTIPNTKVLTITGEVIVPEKKK